MPDSVKVTFYTDRIKADVEERYVPKLLTFVGVEYTNDVKLLMRNSPATGRQYGKHRASAPGEPPAPDTGDLVRSIRFRLRRTAIGWVMEAGSTLRKAVYLEFGAARGVKGKGGRVESVQWILFPRPAWGPALRGIRLKMPALIGRAKGAKRV